MRLAATLLLTLVVSCTTATAFAQTIGATSGSVNGVVIDESGAVIPGVTVTASATAQMGVLSAATNEHGMYRFTNLAPGDYRLVYELAGFQTLSRDGVRV